MKRKNGKESMDIEQGERRREWVTQEKGEGRWEMEKGGRRRET